MLSPAPFSRITKLSNSTMNPFTSFPSNLRLLNLFRRLTRPIESIVAKLRSKAFHSARAFVYSRYWLKTVSDSVASRQKEADFSLAFFGLFSGFFSAADVVINLLRFEIGSCSPLPQRVVLVGSSELCELKCFG